MKMLAKLTWRPIALLLVHTVFAALDHEVIYVNKYP